jgi:ABC-type lipoprotein release transport system permease subunit
MALPLSYNVRSLVARSRVTLLAIGGIALVVAVIVVLLAMVSGFRTVLRTTGLPQNAIVTQRGSMSELTSWMNNDAVRTILTDGRITLGKDGQPLASCELVVMTSLPKRAGNTPTNITVRGVTPRAFDVRTGVKLIDGRMFTEGLPEVIVGKGVLERATGATLGSSIPMQQHDVKVVGIFQAEGSSFESEIWADKNVVASNMRRQGGCESVTVRMKDASLIPAFDRDLQANPRMQVEAKPEIKYYEDQAGPVAGPLMALAGFVAIVMGIGAVIGAMNTMYAIVAARTREVGTLRALGFTRTSVLTAFVIESVFLALVGGALGCLIALPANGFSSGTGQTASFSEIAFAFRITPFDITVGMIFAGIMGVAGGVLPAARAARMPITSALRSA